MHFLKVLGVLTLFGVGLCRGRDRVQKDPVELAKYQFLKSRRLLFETFKEKNLITVPGSNTRENEDDNEPPFVPSLECGDEFYNLTKGTFGTITSPNYPRKYLPDLQCEWILESDPGTVIEITLFDSVTQPWLLTYYDYIKISLDGNWTQFHRFAGDVNYKTPYTLISKDNRIAIRFITSSWLNFRGFSLFYVVRNKSRKDAHPQVNEYGSVLNNDVVAVCQRRPETPPRTNDRYHELQENAKIINGQITSPHQYPFTVALIVDGQYFCSGTLIDDVNVVTAAHCVEDAYRIVLIFGLHNMTNPAERYYSRQIRLVEFPDTSRHVFVHPHFDPDTGANDIAIVRVPQKVKFTGYVQPIYLPSIYAASNAFYGKDLKTVGWGQYDIQVDGISTVLREGRARVISNGDCREEFRGAITGNHICTLTPFDSNYDTTTTRPPHRNLRQRNITKEEEGQEQGEETTSLPEEQTEVATNAPEGQTEAATSPPVQQPEESTPSEQPAPNPETTTPFPEDEYDAGVIEPDYISPCFGDAGGPLFTEFKETLDGSKDPVKQDCVEARPNGSSDENLKSQLACDLPSKQLARKWYMLVGVVSFGTKACGDEIPVAYTRVSAYLEWIAYVTGRHG